MRKNAPSSKHFLCSFELFKDHRNAAVFQALFDEYLESFQPEKETQNPLEISHKMLGKSVGMDRHTIKKRIGELVNMQVVSVENNTCVSCIIDVKYYLAVVNLFYHSEPKAQTEIQKMFCAGDKDGLKKLGLEENSMYVEEIKLLLGGGKTLPLDDEGVVKLYHDNIGGGKTLPLDDEGVVKLYHGEKLAHTLWSKTATLYSKIAETWPKTATNLGNDYKSESFDVVKLYHPLVKLYHPLVKLYHENDEGVVKLYHGSEENEEGVVKLYHETVSSLLNSEELLSVDLKSESSENEEINYEELMDKIGDFLVNSEETGNFAAPDDFQETIMKLGFLFFAENMAEFLDKNGVWQKKKERKKETKERKNQRKKVKKESKERKKMNQVERSDNWQKEKEKEKDLNFLEPSDGSNPFQGFNPLNLSEPLEDLEPSEILEDSEGHGDLEIVELKPIENFGKEYLLREGVDLTLPQYRMLSSVGKDKPFYSQDEIKELTKSLPSGETVNTPARLFFYIFWGELWNVYCDNYRICDYDENGNPVEDENLNDLKMVHATLPVHEISCLIADSYEDVLGAIEKGYHEDEFGNYPVGFDSVGNLQPQYMFHWKERKMKNGEKGLVISLDGIKNFDAPDLKRMKKPLGKEQIKQERRDSLKMVTQIRKADVETLTPIEKVIRVFVDKFGMFDEYDHFLRFAVHYDYLDPDENHPEGGERKPAIHETRELGRQVYLGPMLQATREVGIELDTFFQALNEPKTRETIHCKGAVFSFVNVANINIENYWESQITTQKS